MIRVNVLCEGRTECYFIEKVLNPYFTPKQIYLTPLDLKGGFNFDKLKREICILLKQDKNAYLTTFIDFYGLKGVYPKGKVKGNLTPIQAVNAIEQGIENAIKKVIPNAKFMAYLQLHEFEALLFSDTTVLTEVIKIDYPNLPNNYFEDIRKKFPTPEDINNSVHTAPSKRVIQIAPSYEKIAEGVLIAEEIGIEKMRQECPHFNAWLTKIDKLVP